MKRTLHSLTLIVALTFGVSGAEASEPTYQGRTLSSWLEELSSDQPFTNEAGLVEAMQNMGTNTLPRLLRQIRVKDSKFREQMREWKYQLGDKLGIELSQDTPAIVYRQAAMMALWALDSMAVPAIPDLIRNLSDPEIAQDSAHALMNLDTNSIPYVLPLATRTNSHERILCAQIIGTITNAADIGYPTLLKLAGDSQSRVRYEAIRGLGKMAWNPTLSVPVLIASLNDKDASVVRVACLALGKHGTNAVTALPSLQSFITNRTLRGHAFRAIRYISGNDHGFFLTLLTNQDQAIQFEGLKGIMACRTNATDAIPAVAALLKSPQRNLKSTALAALRRIDPTGAMTAGILVQTLEHEADRIQRHGIIHNLGTFGAHAAKYLPDLERLWHMEPEGDEKLLIGMAITLIDEPTAIRLGISEEIRQIAQRNAEAERERMKKIFPSPIDASRTDGTTPPAVPPPTAPPR